jgi:hypothetical protein
MVRHIWELNGTHSDYFFFTENCSYNMLWLIEVARPSVDLRRHFHFEVIPLESVHAAKIEGIITEKNYRPSKRSILLAYEKQITPEHIKYVKKLVNAEIESDAFLEMSHISQEQKRLIYEASIEYLESSYSKNAMSKEEYVLHFHTLTKARATLGKKEKLAIQTPSDPIESHRAIRASAGYTQRDGASLGLLGIRSAYHDLSDSSVGFLRGTQIEFLNLLLSYDEEKQVEVERATIFSIVSLAQRSEFYNSLSWRTRLGWDRDSLKREAHFSSSVGAGYSFGNEFGYSYAMVDPLFYLSDGFVGGVGGSLGFVIDRYSFMNTNAEATKRYYQNGDEQVLVELSQGFRLQQNLQLQLKYEHKEREALLQKNAEQSLGISLNYYY